MKSGLSHEDAIRAMTINPARIAGLDQMIGSLEPGKDADIAVFTGDPLEVKSEIQAVFSLGRKCV
jgi:imidazolonepropionase-like amidohydrolase